MKNINVKFKDKKWIDVFNLCMSKKFKDKLHLCSDGSYDYGNRYITSDGKYKLFYYKYNGICNSFRIYCNEFSDGDGWIEFEIKYSGNIEVSYYCNIYDEEGEFCCEIDKETYEEIMIFHYLNDFEIKEIFKPLLKLFNY